MIKSPVDHLKTLELFNCLSRESQDKLLSQVTLVTFQVGQQMVQPEALQRLWC